MKDNIVEATSEEEKLHLRYMKTEVVGEPEVGTKSASEELEAALERFKDKFGFDFMTYWLDKNIAAAEGIVDPTSVKTLDGVARKLVGDRQSTEFKMKGLSADERKELAKGIMGTVMDE